MAETRDQIMDHEYDGIREYDNPAPGWWQAIFATTMVFALFYAAYWHTSPMAMTPQESLAATEVSELRLQFASIGTLEPDTQTITKMMADPKWLSVGQSVFRGNCISCHGANGRGEVGPNLTDDYWKNVRTIADIPKVITDGANGGAMPSWKSRLHPNEVVLVAAYVASLRANPVIGRAPEGEKIAPWPDAQATPASSPSADAKAPTPLPSGTNDPTGKR